MWISAEDGWEGMEMIASLFGTWELGGGGDFGRGGLSDGKEDDDDEWTRAGRGKGSSLDSCCRKARMFPCKAVRRAG
jgi:hypothetical protein